jgi:hypothetical protein
MPWFEFRSKTFQMFYLYPCSCGESCLLVSWCAGGRCDMVGSDEDGGRIGRPDTVDQGWSITGRVLNGPMIGRSGNTVCGLHRARGDEDCRFLG